MHRPVPAEVEPGEQVVAVLPHPDRRQVVTERDRERRQVVEDVHRMRGVHGREVLGVGRRAEGVLTGMQPRRAYVEPAGSPTSASQAGSFAQTCSPLGRRTRHDEMVLRDDPGSGEWADTGLDRPGDAGQRQVRAEAGARSRSPPVR